MHVPFGSEKRNGLPTVFVSLSVFFLFLLLLHVSSWRSFELLRTAVELGPTEFDELVNETFFMLTTTNTVDYPNVRFSAGGERGEVNSIVNGAATATTTTTVVFSNFPKRREFS